jgi:hypothetical protein
MGADHAVAIAAICGVLERGALVTRESLVAMTTRAGFPDVDVDEVFRSGDNVDLETAICELLTAS